MKKTYFSLVLSIITSLLTGCYGDKGNYDYSEINSLTIELPSNSYTGSRGDVITIEPRFTFSDKEDESSLTYRWTLEGRLISTERNLHYTVDTMITSGRCELRVTDTRFNVDYLAWTTFKLTPRYGTTGWMVLSDNEGESSLSFWAQRDITTTNYEEYLDVYRTVNGEALGKGLLWMQEHFYPSNTSSAFWIVQQEGGCMDLNANMQKEVVLNDLFLSPAIAETLKPKQIFEMSWLTALVNEDGRLFTRKKLSTNTFHTGKFIDDPVRYNGTDLLVDRIIISRTKNAGYALFVEGLKGTPQRLMALIDYKKQYAGTISPLTYTKNPQFTAHPDNLNGHELLFVGYTMSGTETSGKNYYDLILRNESGEYIFQEYEIAKMNNSSCKVTATEKKQVTLNYSILDGNNLFYIAPLGSYKWLLIAQGSSLYYVDRLTIGTDQPRLLAQFTSPITALDAETIKSATLGVGLENGEFHVLALDGNSPAQIVFSSQAPGRILQIRYKANAASNGW